MESYSQQTIIFEIMPCSFNGCVYWSLPFLFLHVLLPRLLFHPKFQRCFFWFFKCDRKMSISAKKCFSFNLSPIGCFGPIYRLSCTHPGSSRLSATLTDCSFLPLRRLSCLSDSFSKYFYGFLMLFISLHQLDALKTENGCPPISYCTSDWAFTANSSYFFCLHFHLP